MSPLGRVWYGQVGWGVRKSPLGRVRYGPDVAVRNFLVEGVSCSGKTSVCRELRRRGYHAVNGDTELAYQGDPATGLPTGVASHWHHLWQLDRVREIAADRTRQVTFFCGGARNVRQVLGIFDAVFILEIDTPTLERRLDARPRGEFGSATDERALVLRLHHTQEGIPPGESVDATRPLGHVVDELLWRSVRPATARSSGAGGAL